MPRAVSERDSGEPDGLRASASRANSSDAAPAKPFHWSSRPVPVTLLTVRPSSHGGNCPACCRARRGSVSSPACSAHPAQERLAEEVRRLSGRPRVERVDGLVVLGKATLERGHAQHHPRVGIAAAPEGGELGLLVGGEPFDHPRHREGVGEAGTAPGRTACGRRPRGLAPARGARCAPARGSAPGAASPRGCRSRRSRRERRRARSRADRAAATRSRSAGRRRRRGPAGPGPRAARSAASWRCRISVASVAASRAIGSSGS